MTAKLMVAATALAFLLGLSGCAGPGGEQAGDNEGPNAVLKVDKNVAWTGDFFRFDGSESSDPDGQIERWNFEFGDGSEHEDTRAADEDGKVDHAYLEGGEYTVVLTVEDDGGEQSGSLTDQSELTVAVNEQMPVAQTLIQAAIVDQSARSNFSVPFDARDTADRFEVELNVNSTLISGSSEIEIKVISPSNETLDQETVVVGSDEDKTVTLEGPMDEAGTYVVESRAQSGGAFIDGEIRVYYDEGFTE